MSPTVKLSLVERTLNKLARCERKRSGDFLTRLREEAGVLREAFEEVRAVEREACAKAAEDTCGCYTWCCSGSIAEAIRARGRG